MAKTDVTLGIDIGGTNTVFGFVDEEGNCLIESSIPTRSNEEAPKLFERLKPAVDEAFSKISDRCSFIGIGIGAPNANYYKGTVEQPPNLRWGTVNVLDLLKKYFEVPAAITNDANAAAIGEMQFGAAKGMKDFVVITLGTGLGSGVVVNGNLVYGHDGFAGEIGHTIYDPRGRQCGCGRKGCLETYASASGIRRTVFELLCNSTLESELRCVSFNDMTSKMIFDAAQKGDRLALEAFEFTGKVLGIKLADTVAHLSPEAIILFGGLAASGDFLFEPVKRYLEEYTLNIFKNKVKILPSALTKGNTAVLGASALIWNELKKKENI
ncbi:MAG TPA: ROK family protein [Ignavibacteriales bacterium]|nr:ROK family protein [Ignavibacteriales bacterium]